MKFILTESKLERFIFMYLDNQDFVKIKKDDVVYFVNSVDDKYAQIRYDKSNGRCFIYFKFRTEISSFFPLSFKASEMIIGKWVENTLQMSVSDAFSGPATVAPGG